MTLPPRPTVLPSRTYAVKTHMGNAYITISYDEVSKRPLEVFTEVSKSNACLSSESEAIGRLCSIMFRMYKAPASVVIDQLKGITCEPIWDNKRQIKSVADAIAQTLEEFIRWTGTSGVLEESIIQPSDIDEIGLIEVDHDV